MKKQLYSLCLLLIQAAVATAQNAASIPVKEGKEGMYIFLGNQTLHPRNSAYFFGGAVISKAAGANGRFRELARFKAAESLDAFRKTAGEDAVRFIKQLRKLPDDAAVWTYITTHHKMEEFGLLALNMRFLEAMGACYIDREARSLPANTVVRYKVDFITNQPAAGKPSSLEGRITAGQKPLIGKPVLDKIDENDSSMIVSWKSAADGSPDAMFGEIWRKKGNYGRYELVGQTIAGKDAQQQNIIYTWHQPASPNAQYYFYVVPTALTGLPGTPSDTASGISRTFASIDQSSYMKATDTANGIYLNWQPPQQVNLFAGLIVERSKNNSERFQPLDTLPASASYYLDAQVLPNILYHYRIRMMSIRQNTLTVSAQTSAMHKDGHLFLEAPENFSAAAKSNAIVLSWKPSPYPDVAGYYVYRAAGNNQDWELVSNLVKDSLFTDSSVHDARMQYKYTVAAVNYNNLKSEYAAPAFVRLNITAMPAMPLGVLATSDGGRILLTWKDMRPNDELVKGYNIYRRKINAAGQKGDRELGTEALKQNGFEKINGAPVIEVAYSDQSAGNGLLEYAVTSVDALGNESNAYNSVIVTATGIGLRAPSDVSARKTSKGIVVTWSANLQPGVAQYQVFRRQAADKTAVLIGHVTVQQSSYTDTRVTPGQLYFYSVKVSGNNIVSEASLEKGVRY